MEKFLKNIDYTTVLTLKNEVEYCPGAVISHSLGHTDAFSITLFALAAGVSIGEHASKGDAMALILEGSAHIRVDEKEFTVSRGQCIVMPAGHPHALRAAEAFKMLLVVAFK